MAEGGEDIPMNTFPSGSHGGDDEDTDALLRPGERSSGARRKKAPFYSTPNDIPGYKKKTSTTTSFIDTPSGKNIFEEREHDMETFYEDVREVFPRIDKKLLPFIRRDGYNRLVLNLGNKKSVDHVIAFDGRPSDDIYKAKFPKGLRVRLGKTNVEINQKNQDELERLRKDKEELEKRRYETREKLADNDDKIKDVIRGKDGLRNIIKVEEERKENALTQEDKDRHSSNIEKAKEAYLQKDKEEKDLTTERDALKLEETNNDELLENSQEQVESARERVNQRLLSLRDRIKEIFKKHGFTVVAVVSAIEVVIGVIVSSIKAGLGKLADGVGNGLKELGSKLAESLPGMIGSIASLIFKTAGEVIKFLGKNAWLLIVGLVVFVVEMIKKELKLPKRKKDQGHEPGKNTVHVTIH